MYKSNAAVLTEDEKTWDEYLEITNKIIFYPETKTLEIGDKVEKWFVEINISNLSKDYLQKVIDKITLLGNTKTRDLIEAIKESGKFPKDEIPVLETYVVM